MNPNQDPVSNQNSNVDNPLAVMQPGEQVICEIRRTGIGLLGTYVSSAVAIIILALIVVLAPHFVSNISSQIKAAMLAIFFLILIMLLLFTYISTIVYKGNRWIVTTDSITQVVQVGLFRKQTSQLSLANLEDVTAEQNGLLQSMLGFGTLRVETAGERSKFLFPFCPSPNSYAQKVLGAREDFIRNRPAQAERANDNLDVPENPAYTSNDPANGHGI